MDYEEILEAEDEILDKIEYHKSKLRDLESKLAELDEMAREHLQGMATAEDVEYRNMKI